MILYSYDHVQVEIVQDHPKNYPHEGDVLLHISTTDDNSNIVYQYPVIAAHIYNFGHMDMSLKFKHRIDLGILELIVAKLHETFPTT